MGNMKSMNLIDTAEMMGSPDYRERFKAEYYQTKIRREKLAKTLREWETLDFEPTCPKSILSLQLLVMDGYIAILEARADIENVELQ